MCLPLCLGCVLTFLSFCRAPKQTGTEAAAAPGWHAEQWPWGHRPEDRASRNGIGSQGWHPTPTPRHYGQSQIGGARANQKT